MTTDTNQNTKAAGRAVGDTRMVCDHTAAAVRYAAQHCVGFDTKGDLIWEELDHREYGIADLPAVFADGDQLRTLAGYGLRAWLADRTSQFRKMGPAAVLQAMDSYYAECLQKGLWAMPRATGAKRGIDPALVAVVAKLKNIPYATAEAALGKLEADALTVLTAKLADKIAAEREAMATAGSGIDLGDLID